MTVPGMTAGFAAVEITPQPGIHMGGFWGRTSGALEVHDPLWARSLAFGLGGRRVAMVALDLVGLSAASAWSIKSRAAARTGMQPDAVMVCCTHTHAGPLTLPVRGMGEVDAAYLEGLTEAAAQAVAGADADRRAARLAYARPEVRLGINRREDRAGQVIIGRNPDGPTVPYAHVLRASRTGARDLVLFSCACHPVVLGRASHCLSAEFPGAAVRALEERTGMAALFVNGACGDINPRVTGAGFEAMEGLGGELAERVVAALTETRPLESDHLAWRSVQLQLPLVDPPHWARAMAHRAALTLKAGIHRIRAGGGDYWSQLVPRARLEWAEAMLALSRSGRRGLGQTFQVQGLRVGSLALLGMEGEIFSRYQLDLEATSPLQPTAVVGYANGCIGYVPTADEHRRGGYEAGEPYGQGLGSAVQAYQVYPSVQMLAPAAEAVVRAGAEGVLTALADPDPAGPY
ncbi:MAG: hypothetical protein ABIL09_15835 [Gemmatimonadota bacterium]